MLLIAVKVLLAPAFVVLASLAGRRFGARFGGFVGGMPVVAGPILLAYALAHGGAFASHAATGTLLGLVSLMAFVVAYGRLARRLSWRLSLPLGWLAFAAATSLFALAPSSPLLALALCALALAVAPLLLPRVAPVQDAPPSLPGWDLPLRAGATLALVLALTAASGWLGPHLSGLLAPFPIVGSVLAAFTHGQRGAAELIHLLRGLLLGYGAFGLFCFTLAVSLTPLGIAAAFGLACVAALLCQGSVLAWQRMRAARDTAEAARAESIA